MCPRTSADSEKASSGTANAISWKSNWASCCRPQENPYATAMARPGPTPSFSRASWLTGKIDAATSSACATTSVAEDGKIAEEGRQHRDDRLEVVPEQVEAGGPDVHDRRVEIRRTA